MHHATTYSRVETLNQLVEAGLSSSEIQALARKKWGIGDRQTRRLLRLGKKWREQKLCASAYAALTSKIARELRSVLMRLPLSSPVARELDDGLLCLEHWSEMARPEMASQMDPAHENAHARSNAHQTPVQYWGDQELIEQLTTPQSNTVIGDQI